MSHFIQNKHSEEATSGNISFLHLFFFLFLCNAFTTAFTTTSSAFAFCSTLFLSTRESMRNTHSFTPGRGSSSLLCSSPAPKLPLGATKQSNAVKLRSSADRTSSETYRDAENKTSTFLSERSGAAFFFSLNFSRMVLHRRSSVHCVQRASVSPQQKATGSRAP